MHLQLGITLTLIPLLCLPFLLFLSAFPDPYPALVSIPNRSLPPARRLAASPTSQPQRPDFEFDVLPFVLISTIDGALHAVERDGGKVRWTLKDGVEPLVGGGGRGKARDEEYIVEPLSGSLYVFEDEEDEQGAPKVRKLPLSVERLIELSPFTFPHSPSRVFTGSKHTSLLTLDIRSGHQLDAFSSRSSNFSYPEEPVCEEEQLLDDLEGRSRSTSDVLFVGRSDYRLTVHTPPLASSGFHPSTSTMAGADKISPGTGSGSGAQEIVYSTYTPNTFDRPLADYWSRMGTRGGSWEAESETEGEKRVRVELGHDGLAVGAEEGGVVRWTTHLGSIGIAVYDILLPVSETSSNPILLPQPPPHLPSLFPLPAHAPPEHLDIWRKAPSTYIGAVPFPPSGLASAHSPTEENSSIPSASKTPNPGTNPLLYALSSSSYPLINFAPPPRPGSLTNASFLLSEDLPERDQLLPYILDPPVEKETSLSVPEEHGLSTEWGIKEKEVKRVWKWWIAGVLGGMMLLISAVFAVGRKGIHGIKQATTPPGEETPLLVEEIEKTNPLILEAEIAATAASAVTPPATSLPEIEKESDAGTKRKTGRRRVRGKKKRRDSSAIAEMGEEDEEGEGEEPSGTDWKDRKPLPELPREISSAGLPSVGDGEKERLVISDTVIGFGSHGTVVLKGTWGGRPVAVKRLLSDFVRLASQEVKLLQASDDHQNVIRYYCQERRDNFLYIALDLCQASLADLIETPEKHSELAGILDRKKALSEITAGLKHLHGMKIIHRDIKPQNVLVSKGKDGQLKMLVSDFGLARRLEQGQSSFAPTANNLAGSLGWRAPECIRGQVRLNEGFECSSSTSTSSNSSLLDLTLIGTDTDRSYARLTKAVDLFALGCLYFWVLMSGQHPFGETYNRESNIVKGDAVGLESLDILGEEGWEAKELIGRLLSKDPEDRPDTAECLSHPFFWTPAKRLAFLCDASDRFEIMELDPPEETLVALETNAEGVVGKDWYHKLDRVFISNLGKYRKYRGGSVRDLLRALRNKKHHYQDLEPVVKKHLGNMPSGFLSYFTGRFPQLLLHVYATVKHSKLRDESMFENYFGHHGA
ncbi:serine/threonine-protein kinase/endoribonuclease IRE1, partial [Tremellales sp. Uapishka_1]